jgi:hypothetical protein
MGAGAGTSFHLAADAARLGWSFAVHQLHRVSIATRMNYTVKSVDFNAHHTLRETVTNCTSLLPNSFGKACLEHSNRLNRVLRRVT